MAAIKYSNGKKMVIDCNITEENKDAIISFLIEKTFSKIDIFINSHRDSDHLRGIKFLDDNIPIAEIWDNGVSGTTDATDYKEYMELRRKKRHIIIKAQTKDDPFCENTVIRYMNSDYDDTDYDINDTSIVVKIEYKGSSILFAGDTSFKPWKEKIMTSYHSTKIKSNILVASHHGSKTFFDDPSNNQYYYANHIKAISPDITIISVGKNKYDLPDKEAIEMYTKYSKGSSKGNKVFSTDEVGNIYVGLKDDGSWTLTRNV
jgi:beta-lactamase superfamily II metal-dependent hydrolase